MRLDLEAGELVEVSLAIKLERFRKVTTDLGWATWHVLRLQ
jgi:hypothetical protein